MDLESYEAASGSIKKKVTSRLPAWRALAAFPLAPELTSARAAHVRFPDVTPHELGSPID